MTEVALFFKIDDEPRFGVTICDVKALDEAVHGSMFSGAPTEEQMEEVREILGDLRTHGRVDFEDGWLELRSSMADAIAFVVERCREARAEEQYADRRAGEEHRRATAADAKYQSLRTVILAAMGDNARAVIEAIAPATSSAPDTINNELLAAAKTVMAGLEGRIDKAVDEGGHAVPVFNGIADLHDAIARAESA